MTLEEAIKHCEEKAEELYKQAFLCHANPNDDKLDDCIECANEHKQLAGWLKDYKRLLEMPKGDLISREALKKAIFRRCRSEEENLNCFWYDENIVALINNAPTVDLWQLRQEATENALKKAEVLYGRPQGEYVDISKLRLMTVEECAGHTIEYAMGWKACVEWIKKGGNE